MLFENQNFQKQKKNRLNQCTHTRWMMLKRQILEYVSLFSMIEMNFSVSFNSKEKKIWKIMYIEMVCLESWRIVEWAFSQPQECFYVELLLVSWLPSFSFVTRTFAQSTFALDEIKKDVCKFAIDVLALVTVIISYSIWHFLSLVFGIFFSLPIIYGFDGSVGFIALLEVILLPRWRLQVRP